MKIAIVLLACVVVVFSQRPGGSDALGRQMHQSIGRWLHQDPHMTIAECMTKCDATYDLIGVDESMNDVLCDRTCTCEVQKNCPHHQNGGSGGHTGGHTRPAHPTHTRPAHPRTTHKPAA